ncbi:MAG: diguanylate cyclase [Methylococcales bacterium]|nr:diguanylate cyclase [Methylococcales bacterium]
MNTKPLKILAIDDVPANLYLLGLALQDEYQFKMATSGAQGLQMANEDPPDLILLDIMMPDMDGFEICRRLKNDSKLQDIPVVFVTALSEQSAEAKGLALGAADYLCKPVNLEIARIRIRNLLEREALRRELKQQVHQQNMIASVFDHIHDGIVISDACNNIIDINEAFTRITGYEREDVLGKNPRLLKSGRQSDEFYKSMWHSLLTKNHWTGQIWNRNKNGEIYAALTSISAVRDAQQNIQHFIGLFTDITQLKNHESNLERIAHFDPLTGVPNRLLLADRLKQAIAQTKRSGTLMAVCYMDLDSFKPVNDRYGHNVGDQLLISISQRIKDCLRAGDTVARMGGDEFVLLLLGFNDIKECESVLTRMLNKVAETTVIQGHHLTVSASLGFTLFPADMASAEVLLHHADQAMYMAKERGKNRFHLYEASTDHNTVMEDSRPGLCKADS